ncbi:unnamed protein product [Nyctereutes procyonoides]|uniref:(raccoon dog) hypothetical protein n=1 Tax=Nyctereutes procyonoides TaxID=34880 RepID=A0A811YG71_NYCPR|nr:unnamed protein product [Nyctereutes procyonoides]
MGLGLRYKLTLESYETLATQRWAFKLKKKKKKMTASIHHRRHNLSKVAYQAPVHPCSVHVQVSNGHFVVLQNLQIDKKKKKRTFLEGEHQDEIYLKRLHPRQLYDVEIANCLLKTFQNLDFTNPKQSISFDLTLDMVPGKKKNGEPLANVLRNASEIKIAEENGAAILDDEIQSDFYVAVPEIMPKLNPLKKKMEKKKKDFQDLEFHCLPKKAILDMSTYQIAANLCLNLGPSVVGAFTGILLLRIEPLLPKGVETKESSSEAVYKCHTRKFSVD